MRATFADGTSFTDTKRLHMQVPDRLKVTSILPGQYIDADPVNNRNRVDWATTRIDYQILANKVGVEDIPPVYVRESFITHPNSVLAWLDTQYYAWFLYRGHPDETVTPHYVTSEDNISAGGYFQDKASASIRAPSDLEGPTTVKCGDMTFIVPPISTMIFSNHLAAECDRAILSVNQTWYSQDGDVSGQILSFSKIGKPIFFEVRQLGEYTGMRPGMILSP